MLSNATEEGVTVFHAGLVLEGGGMRGVYTAGVLDFFLEQNLLFESIYGVSAGAVQACSYLSRQKGRGYACAVDYLEDWRYLSLRSLLLTGDLFGVKMCYDTIPKKLYPFDDAVFESSPSRLYAVIVDVKTGTPVYYPVTTMETGLVVIRASASLPFVSRMVRVDGRWTLDGGIADSIPLKKSLTDGFARNVVVLTQDATYRKKDSTMNRWAWLRYPFRRALRARMQDRHIRYNEQLALVDEMEKEGKAFVIRPDLPVNISRIEKDKKKLKALYDQGYADAKRLYPALLAYLEGQTEQNT